MPKARTYHVIPHDGTWAVRSQASGTMWIFDSKSAAIDDARKRAREQNEASRIVVHGKSGQIIQNTSVKSRLTDKAIRDAVRSVGNPQNGDSVKAKPNNRSKVMRASKR
jgi:hypothetical protein